MLLEPRYLRCLIFKIECSIYPLRKPLRSQYSHTSLCIAVLPILTDARSCYSLIWFNNMQKWMSFSFLRTSITFLINIKFTYLSTNTRRFSQLYTTQVFKSCFPYYRNVDETFSPSWVKHPLKTNICVVLLRTVSYKTQNSLRPLNSQTG